MAILAIARTIARKGIKFQSNVQLAAFAGEEQGLLGSKAYARKALIMYFLLSPHHATDRQAARHRRQHHGHDSS
jgi:Zn-dependent M28 family amino/carboxypeptidase